MLIICTVSAKLNLRKITPNFGTVSVSSNFFFSLSLISIVPLLFYKLRDTNAARDFVPALLSGSSERDI